MKKNFKVILIILFVIVTFSVIIYQFSKLYYYKSEEYKKLIIIDSFFENYFNKDQIKYKMEFNYETGKELKEVPWGINPSQLKFMEKLELMDENDKYLKYRGYPNLIYMECLSKEKTINYYFNEKKEFYSVKIDMIVEKDDFYGSLFDVLVPWIEKYYNITTGNIESIAELNWKDKSGVEHSYSTVLPNYYSTDYEKTLKEIMGLKDLYVKKLVFDNSMVYKQKSISGLVMIEVLIRKYDDLNAILSYTFTNEKLVDE